MRPANDAQRDKDGVLPEWWLVAEWPADKDEPVTYWRSNLPDQTPIVTLVRLAKLRWRVEHDDRELKNASGSITTRAAPSAGCTTTSPASPSPTPF